MEKGDLTQCLQHQNESDTGQYVVNAAEACSGKCLEVRVLCGNPRSEV